MIASNENIEMNELHSSQDDGNVDKKDLIKEKPKKKSNKNKMQQLKREIEMVVNFLIILLAFKFDINYHDFFFEKKAVLIDMLKNALNKNNTFVRLKKPYLYLYCNTFIATSSTTIKTVIKKLQKVYNI